MSNEQSELPFEHSWRSTKLGAEAWEWIHTDMGGQVTNDFIRLALYCKTRLNKKVGQRAIWEKLRWSYEYERPDGEEYLLNNNYTKYVALFAEERVPELKGYFDFRERQERKGPIFIQEGTVIIKAG